MLLSIILPCRNEERYIEDAVESVYRTGIDPADFELLVIDGMSTDKTAALVQNLQKKYENLRLVENKNRTVPYAMNLGIQKALGDYIVRLDAHCMYPDNYFEKLLEWQKRLDADNVGGVIITETKSKSPAAEAIVTVLSDKYGVGNSYFRIGIDEVREVDTVPFGFFKREVFDKYGLYDVRLKRSQDIELNRRIKAGGGHIFLIPEIKLVYFSRETFGELFKKYFENGKWNVFVAYYTKRLKSLSIRNFIPVIFVFTVIVSLILSLHYSVFLIFPLLYLIIMSVRSLYLSVKKKKSFVHILAAFAVLHFSHGLGALSGMVSLLNPYHRKIRNKGRMDE